jgi:hypothetical protein
VVVLHGGALHAAVAGHPQPGPGAAGAEQGQQQLDP